MRLSHWITITFFSWFQFQFNFTNTDTKHTFGLLHSWFLRRSWPGRLDNPQMMRSTSCPESAGHNKTGRSLCSLILILYKFVAIHINIFDLQILATNCERLLNISEAPPRCPLPPSLSICNTSANFQTTEQLSSPSFRTTCLNGKKNQATSRNFSSLRVSRS